MKLSHLIRLSTILICAPAAQLAGEEAAQSEAISAIEKLGGSVRPLSKQNRNALEVRFHLRGRALTDDGLAHLTSLSNVVSLNLRDTKITGAGPDHLQAVPT